MTSLRVFGGSPHAPAATDPFWIQPLPALLAALNSGEAGLSSADAARRLVEHGPNTLAPPSRGGVLLSFLLDSPTDGLIILGIVLVSGLLGFWQEHGAAGAVAQLLEAVQTTAVLR